MDTQTTKRTPEEQAALNKARADKLIALHALLMSAITRAELSKRDAWRLGLGLLTDIVSRSLADASVDNLAEALIESVNAHVLDLRSGRLQPQRTH